MMKKLITAALVLTLTACASYKESVLLNNVVLEKDTATGLDVMARDTTTNSPRARVGYAGRTYLNAPVKGKAAGGGEGAIMAVGVCGQTNVVDVGGQTEIDVGAAGSSGIGIGIGEWAGAGDWLKGISYAYMISAARGENSNAEAPTPYPEYMYKDCPPLDGSIDARDASADSGPINIAPVE